MSVILPAIKLVSGSTSKHVARARASSIRWIERIIATAWLPDEGVLKDGLVMIQDEFGPTDTTRVLWQKNGYSVRVSQTKTVIVVTLAPVKDSRMGGTIQTTKDAVGDLFKKVLRNHSRVEITENNETVNIAPEGGTLPVILSKSVEQGRVRKCYDGIDGRPARRGDDREDRLRFSHWWRRLGWWTDGRIVGFHTIKTQGGESSDRYEFDRDKTWFEGGPKWRGEKFSLPELEKCLLAETEIPRYRLEYQHKDHWAVGKEEGKIVEKSVVAQGWSRHRAAIGVSYCALTSPKAAIDAGTFYASNRASVFKQGSFSGQPLGDKSWIADAQTQGEGILFVRGSKVVLVSCWLAKGKRERKVLEDIARLVLAKVDKD